MADFFYEGKLIQVRVTNDEAFVNKLNKKIDNKIATECEFSNLKDGALNLYRFTQDGERYYVYEELIENENGFTSILYISDSEISTFEDMILRSKECLEIFKTT